MGRPIKQPDITEDAIENIAALGCTVDEIAAVTGVSDVTLRKRFLPSIEKGRQRMKMSVRRMQYEAAKNGNVTMMIWLGKQYLGQRDRQEIQQETTVHVEASDAKQRLLAALGGSLPAVDAGAEGASDRRAN